MSLKDTVEAFKKGVQETRSRQSSEQEAEVAERQVRVGAWIENNLEKKMRESVGRTEVVIDTYNEYGINYTDAGCLAAQIATVTGLETKVEIRSTCSYGDDHMRREPHVIISV